MSFLNSISSFVSGAGHSINASARKLVSSISQDSNSGTEVMTPNIEVSDDSESKLPQAGALFFFLFRNSGMT